MGSHSYVNFILSINKELKKPFFQRYKTFGGYKVVQFGVLGLFVQINYGFQNER